MTGVDYSERAVAFAKAFNTRGEFYTGDLNTFKSKKKFDYIILSEVLEHIPKKEINKMLKNLHSLLKKNGELIITVPHKNLPLEDKHEQHFDKDSITQTIYKYFKVKAIFGMSSIGKDRSSFNFTQHIANVMYPFRNKFGFVKKMYKNMTNYYDEYLRTCKHYEGQRLLVRCVKK
jgi:2-polyprenyl-3-methyl-5-hydroxy-6-metoxy-1,4-benzoquinol methylase